jgi:hypothetical protein
MSNETISRRTLIKGALVGLTAVPAAVLANPQAAKPATPAAPAAAGGLLDPASAQAKALGYVHDATKVDAKANPMYKAGQHCGNCIQFTAAATAEQGPCNLFPGKVVKNAGWCKVWVLKPGAKLG